MSCLWTGAKGISRGLMWGSLPLLPPPQCRMSGALPGNLTVEDLPFHTSLPRSSPCGTPWCPFTLHQIQHLLKKSLSRKGTETFFPTALFLLLDIPSRYHHHFTLRWGIGSRRRRSMRGLGEGDQSSPQRAAAMVVLSAPLISVLSVSLSFRAAAIPS